jgi:hypothetical protein
VKTGAATNTFGWLAAKYFASVEFLAFDDVHQRERRNIIEACLQEPLKPGSDKTMSHVHVTLLDAAHFCMLRDRKVKAKLPGAANARLKYLSSMLSWATTRRHTPKRQPQRTLLTKKSLPLADARLGSLRHLPCKLLLLMPLNFSTHRFIII